MKKTIFLSIFLFVYFFAFSQELPYFNKDSNAIVIDSFSYTKNADTVKFINKTEYERFSVYVYVYKDDNWYRYARAEIQQKDKQHKIERIPESKTVDYDIDNYRYIAFVLNNSKKQSFSFDYSIEVKRHDLLVSISDIKNFVEKNNSIQLNNLSENKYEREYSFSVPKANIKIAKLWVVETFNSSKDVIEMYDEDLNVLLGNGVKDGFTPLFYSFKISTKNDNVTIKFYNIKSGTAKVSVGIGTTGLDSLFETFEDLAKDLNNYYSDF